MIEREERAVSECIYTVWGPTAEWGDGSGPLYYTDSLKSAGAYVREERARTIEYVYQGADDSGVILGPVLGEDTTTETLDSLTGRALYDACAALSGWPSRDVRYWIESEDRSEFLARIEYDGDTEDRDAVFEYLNSN